MSTPSKAKARRRGKNVRPAWLAAKRRPRGSPAADYTHPINKALGQAIRAWRIAHGLTVSAVARLAQLARDTGFAYQASPGPLDITSGVLVIERLG